MISWSIAGALFAVIGIPLVILVFDLWTKAAEKGTKKPEPGKKPEPESDSKSVEEKGGGAAS